MTWKDIKLITLQKMFSANGNEIVNDETTRDYLAAMPYAANEALQLLCGSNKYLRSYAEIPKSEGSVMRADMTDYTDDFFRFGDLEAYDQLFNQIQFSAVAGTVAIIPEDASGTIRVYYDAWPKPITSDTPDDYNLPLSDDVCVLLPLYMASQIYKDDDNSIATIYRNEFEVARAELANRTNGVVSEEFTSVTGWI